MTEREAYWSGHLAAIEREGITTKAYAEREGLSVGALYQWRRELKSRVLAPTTPRAEFVRLAVPPESTEQRDAVACRLRLGLGVTVELMSLPSAAWLASVAEALG